MMGTFLLIFSNSFKGLIHYGQPTNEFLQKDYKTYPDKHKETLKRFIKAFEIDTGNQIDD